MAKKITVPDEHEAGMDVPKGGSSCATCKYLRPKLNCANEYFQNWNGGPRIPTESADSYCSDWYEPKDMKKSLGDLLKDQKDEKA